MSAVMGFGALAALVLAIVVMVPFAIALVMLVPMVRHLRAERRAEVSGTVPQSLDARRPGRWTSAA